MEKLPPELLVHIFSFLKTMDKNAVRSCCRYFHTLIDHPGLWRDFTVFLSDMRRYTYGFWDTLNRRRITRAAVRHLRRKEWRRLITFFPSLTTIVFVDGGRLYKEKYLVNLARFPELTGLGVRNATWDERMLSWDLAEQLRERLTHLSVCNVRLPWPVEFINAVSRLVNLRSLLFHQHAEGLGGSTIRPVPCSAFHHMLQQLKKLQHLSWGMKGEPPEPLEEDYFSPPDPNHTEEWVYGGPALVSLELVDYPEAILPENALENLSSLRSLTVRYKSIHQGLECRLKHWLSPLYQLESLTIAGGHSISNYSCALPPTLTSLTLRLSLTLKDMESIAPRVPALRHLDIEQNRSSVSLCRRFPALFPQLRTLRIRFLRREPEKDLLSLHRLQHLKRLDLFVDRWCLNGKSWPTPFVQDLIEKLRQLSGNRIHVSTKTPPRNVLRECDCVYEDH